WGGGIMRTVRLTRSTPEDDLLAVAERRARSFLRHGVTAIEAKTGYGLTPDAEEMLLRVAGRLAQASPMRAVSTVIGAHVVPACGGSRRWSASSVPAPRCP